MWLFAWASLRLQGCASERVHPQSPSPDWSRFDGLLIGGGDDVGADLYGGAPTPNVRLDPARDVLELSALDAFWGTAKPILGVCRGAQMMNIFRGGTLHQDIYKAYAGAPRLRTVLPLKDVHLRPGRLRDIVAADCVRVNALHHQSIQRPGEGMQVVGVDEYGIVQAVETSSGPLRIAVQWHPEFLPYRSAHRRLFRAFARAARGLNPCSDGEKSMKIAAAH